MYENAFNTIECSLLAEEGISNELDCVEQTSWGLFIKYLQAFEPECRDPRSSTGPSLCHYGPYRLARRLLTPRHQLSRTLTFAKQLLQTRHSNTYKVRASLVAARERISP